MDREQSSHHAMTGLFKSVSADQKLNEAIAELNKFKEIFAEQPDNAIIRNKYAELNCKCGDLYLIKKQYKEAKAYFTTADGLVPKEHHLKLSISTNLLQIEEALYRANGTAAAPAN